MSFVIALLFPEEVRDGLAAVNRALRLGCDRGSFTHTENFHYTLAFLGEGDRPVGVPALLEGFPAGERELTLTGWGCRPDEVGKTYWLGAEESPELRDAKGELKEKLTLAGFQTDEKTPASRLILVRGFKAKHGFDPGAMLSRLPERRVKACRLSLLKSERILGRPVYTELYGKEL